jgi:hypothetical protein
MKTDSSEATQPWIARVSRRLRRVLIALVGLITLVAVFYTVEDWRGKRAWESYKHEMEAKGRLVDWKAFIPAPVADESNIFKAPKMAEWFVGKGTSALNTNLDVAQHTPTGIAIVAEITIVSSSVDSGNDTVIYHLENSGEMSNAVKQVHTACGPSARSCTIGAFFGSPLDQIKPTRIAIQADRAVGIADLEKIFGPKSGDTTCSIEATGANSFRIVVKNAMNAANFLEATESINADFDTIRVGLKCPFIRMDDDYQQLFEIPMPRFITIRSTVQMLAKRAQCHMLVGEFEKALQDVTLINDMRRLLDARPMTLVSAMINVAVAGLYADTVADGFRLHAWREPELVIIQQQLANIRLIPPVAESIESERVGVSHLLETLKPQKLSDVFGGLKSKSLILMPRGWLYQNMVLGGHWMEKFDETIDSARQYISPQKVDALTQDIAAEMEHRSPYNFLAGIGIPNLAKATQTCGKNQAMANLALLACALERYLMANGQYPDVLDKLVPQFAQKIPLDIVKGQPLHYRCTDGTRFTLYSVGWNEADDGGNADLDWIWQYPSSL